MTYNQDQALNCIFSENESALSPKYCVYKSRYKKNKLSQKKIDEILLDNGFYKSQESQYKKDK